MVREKNYRGQTLVGGIAERGDRVAFEDMANPRKTGTVLGAEFDGFTVVWDDGGSTRSDLRQPGWTVVEQELHCGGCGIGLGYYRDGVRDYCDPCRNAAGQTHIDAMALYAAVRLWRALRMDPLADAHGASEGDLVVWTKQRATELGWSNGQPVVVWEGGPYEWSIAVTGAYHVDSDYGASASKEIGDAVEWPRQHGLYFEPINGFMLGVYRA